MDGSSSADSQGIVDGPPPPSQLAMSEGGPSNVGIDNSHNSDNPDHPGFILVHLTKLVSEESPEARIIFLYELQLKTRCVNIYQFSNPTGRDVRIAEANRFSLPLYVVTDALKGVPVVAEGPA
ncbi:hypothetical protein CH63R_10282 [Colletotrichum higginsianum IMI 349063]|uniref:Uncharacterized protein n=1 Tax=Colletotrichum higginsianum (strain IMI 349063) TaxID=759273 RepID=A0A1B7Y2D9_COLHI|nr:uncharacterized protein CH63R_10282 [Colletotrichum higginsianum IMI 349063]OBR06162.1 hypothetical protein CH63R_10282 [Colletotrichum higginsianum IMI 349063]